MLHQEVQVDGDLGQDGDKWLDSGSMLEEKLPGFADNTWDMKKREQSHFLA